MARSKMTTEWNFPNDENGDVLRRMHQDGDDLTKARDIEFTVVFPDEASAQSFADLHNVKGLVTSLARGNCDPELPWDVVVTKNMVPTHQSITAFEATLQIAAKEFGGRNGGWGCFAQDATPH